MSVSFNYYFFVILQKTSSSMSNSMTNGYSSTSSTNNYSSFTKRYLNIAFYTGTLNSIFFSITYILHIYIYFSYQNGNVGGTTNSGLSLDGLRKPKIDSWDSMGILGLTTKIWNDTKKRQETFLESTGRILREETSSYIM